MLLIRFKSFYIQHSRVIHELAFFLVVSITILLAFSVVLRHGGWPLNHDQLNAKTRIEVYASHLKQGDLIPLWSSSDGYGMGTPMPGYYQKLFYYIAGTLFALFPITIKTSILLGLAVFFYVGAYGMRRAARMLTSLALIAGCASLAFIFSNYAFTDWLVRGDVAEFSAMMLVPWLLAWCIALVKYRQFSLSIIPIMWLLVLAHNAIAMLSILVLVIAFIVYAAEWKKSEIKRDVLRGIAIVAGTAALLVPFMASMLFFGSDYDPSTKIIEGGFDVGHNFRNLDFYFHRGGYVWLSNWLDFTFQIDYAITIAIILAVLTIGMIILVRKFGHKKVGSVTFGRMDIRALIVLVGTLIMYFLLQLKASLPIYRTIHPLQLVQFPWRMVALITPLAILLLVLLVSAMSAPLLAKSGKVKAVAIVVLVMWLASFYILSPIIRRYHYAIFPSTTVRTVDAPGAKLMIEGGEYLPKVYKRNAELDANSTLSLYIKLHSSDSQSEVLSGSCDITRKVPIAFDALSEKFQINCTKDSTIALGISYNKYMIIRDGAADMKFNRVKTDPRIIVNLKAGDHNVTVNNPSLLHIIKGASGTS